jgi:Nucleotidyl transferase AbiEii toxin, Type IV TA system
MGNPIEALDLSAWVARAAPDKRPFREAVHIILTAIGTSTSLRTQMIMKGGMLMAIRYDSSRFTKDADFSTRRRYVQGDQETLLQALDEQLTLANEQLPYDMMCRRQKVELRPPGPDATFPTLILSIGYAPRSKPRELQRLLAGQAPTIVEIDYSYNEAVLDVEVLRLADGDTLQAYSLINLMAEKFRSLLQQPLRKRNRRQDVYDLALLIEAEHVWDESERARLLTCLMASAQSRGIAPDARSLRNPQIRIMASEGYGELQPEIDGDLPPFEALYSRVQAFYEGLPWQGLSGEA